MEATFFEQYAEATRDKGENVEYINASKERYPTIQGAYAGWNFGQIERREAFIEGLKYADTKEIKKL